MSQYLLNKLREHVSFHPAAALNVVVQRVVTVLCSICLRRIVREHGSLRPAGAF